MVCVHVQTELPVLETPLSRRVRKVVAEIQASAAGGRVPRLYIIRQRDPSESTSWRAPRHLPPRGGSSLGDTPGRGRAQSGCTRS